MITIDAHQHFWYYDPQRHGWITDEMRNIRRDFLPADLAPVLQANDVNGCIAVQTDQTEAETQFLLQLSRENSFIKGIVGWVDLQSPGIAERLAYYYDFPAIKGFRHILQGESQRDLFLQPAFLKGISLLEQYKFKYDLLVLPDQLRDVAKLVSAFPNQYFVIDHLAKPAISHAEIGQWEKDMRGLAQHENVYCKVSGLVTEAKPQHWQQSDFSPYLEVVTAAFGVERLMFGSDWPVCLSATGYAEVLQIVKSYFQSFSLNEQEQVFAKTAIDFYGIDRVL